MARRARWTWSLAVGWVLLGAVSASARPNIVFVLVDTLRADRLGTYGSDRVDVSPNIDAFAEQAVVFEQAISQANWTVPSVASLFTGLYPASHGVDRDRNDQSSATALAPGTPTLSGQLRDAGYETVALIKNGVIGDQNGLSRGFGSWTRVPGPTATLDSAETLTDAAIRWLASRDESRSPFFLYLHYADPHSDYRAPDPFHTHYLDPTYQGPIQGTTSELRALSQRSDASQAQYAPHMLALYDAEIRYLDRHLGRLLTHLAETGRDDDTIVVLTSDHGEQMFEHGSWLHRDLHQENIHVPMMLRGPGIPARRVGGWVELFDLGPTLLQLTGTPQPPGLHARSRVRQLLGTAVPPEPIYSEHHLYKAVIDGPHKLIVSATSPRGSGRHLPRLYDLDADPGEVRNLQAEEGERLAELLALYHEIAQRNARSNPVPAAVRTLSDEELRMLRAMGYIE